MCQQVDQGWVFCIAHGGNQEGWCMALAEMIVWSVGGGLKFVEVENGRKVSGGSRAQRASFSMVSTNMARSFCMWLVAAMDRTLEAKGIV